MKAFTQLQPGDKTYLLIPVMPTPNGGMHLGHLAGPYLKMDVLARAQRRAGNTTYSFFGADVYESYMNLKAWQTGKSEAALCAKNNARIQADLAALKIDYDQFINPLDAQHEAAFKVFFTTALNELVAKSVTELRPEKYLYSKEEDCCLAGCWVSGLCPVCGSGSGSYQCEDCGTQYRPMDLISPTFKRGNHPLTAINDKELYLAVSKQEALLQHLENMQIDAAFIDIVKTYFKQQGNYIRLTNPGNYGIPYEIEDCHITHVLFTYTALYFYSLYCGELYKQQFNQAVHPFGKTSEVITVASFGIDCTVPYLAAGVALALEGDAYKPIDYILPNHFFTLENAKFSTSRGHAIWGSDIVHNTPVSADAVRYFLVLHNPEHAMTDFSVEAFLQCINEELALGLQPLLQAAWAALQQPAITGADEVLSVKLEALLITQNNYLTPPGFELKMSSTPLKKWIDYGVTLSLNENNAYRWLKGFVLLAFPLMPDVANTIWHLLGHTGEPVAAHYFTTTAISVNKPLPVFFETVTFDDLIPALPQTLLARETN